MTLLRFSLFASLLQIGCTTTRPERTASTVAEARLCLEPGALQPGQRVRVERRTCEGLDCTVDPVARGEVVRLVGDRCAMVRIGMGAPIHRGDEVELSPPPPSTRASR